MDIEKQDSTTDPQSSKAGVRERFYMLWVCYQKLFKVIYISILLLILLLITTLLSPFIHFKKLDIATDWIWDKIPLET